MQYPITVTDIKFTGAKTLKDKALFGGPCGTFVSIRSCRPEHGDKTYLGVLLGDLALAQSAHFDAASGVLTIEPAYYNPAIFVPDLSCVLMGSESWWGTIDSEADLKQITDADIQNVWYVKALKSLQEKA